jgi:hypothetical protein
MKNIKQGVFLLCGFLLGIAISALPIKQEQPDQQMIDLFN